MRIRKAAKKDCGDKNLPRKFERWEEENHKLVTDLRISYFHPLKMSDLDKVIVEMKFKEKGDGFIVSSIDISSVTQHLSALHAKAMRQNPGIVCMSTFVFESEASGKQCNSGIHFSMLREISDFAGIIKKLKYYLLNEMIKSVNAHVKATIIPSRVEQATTDTK